MMSQIDDIGSAEQASDWNTCIHIGLGWEDSGWVRLGREEGGNFGQHVSIYILLLETMFGGCGRDLVTVTSRALHWSSDKQM